MRRLDQPTVAMKQRAVAATTCRDRSRTGPFLLVALLITLPVIGQEQDVPRTTTFSGLVSPPFPYARPEEAGLSSETLSWLGDEIVRWIANEELVGAELLVIKDGKAVFHEAYGWSDREKGLPVERDSIWWIGGASKPFIATAVLMLVEEGRLSLDDPVSRYIPEFGGDPSTTIRHLLTHTSGFGERSDVEEEDFVSLEAWVTDWAAEGPSRPFGEFYNSDFSFQALGYIVGAVSGTPVDRFLTERNGVRLLSEATVEEALTVHARDEVLYGYGHGWYLHESPDAAGPPWNFHHWGRVGVQAIAFPGDDSIVIYMTHSRWGPHHDAFWNRLGMSGLFESSPGPDMLPADSVNLVEVPLSGQERALYVGSYLAQDEVDSAFEAVRVWERDGRLHAGIGARGSAANALFHLVPLGDGRFAWGRYADGELRGLDPAFTLRFVVEDGEVIAVDVMEGDEVHASARRIE